MAVHSSMFRSRFFALACLSLLATAMALPSAIAAATPPITFDVSIGDGYIYVSNTADAPTNVRLQDKNGNTKASTVLAGNDSFFDLPAEMTVEIGDRIRASDGSFTRTLIVPALTAMVDRVNDLFHGTGPAQRTPRVGWGGEFGDVFESQLVRVDEDGAWSIDPGFDVGGGQQVYVDLRTPNGDWVRTRGAAPMLSVTLGSARFWGLSGDPFADVEVLIDDGHDGAWSGQSDHLGEFSGRFRRPNGNLIHVAAGDHVNALSMASDLDWVVPDVQINADAASELVTGECDGRLAEIGLWRSGHRRGYVLVQPGSSDEFEFDFSDPDESDYVTGIMANEANVKHGDSLRVQCVLASGDRVHLFTIVP